VYIPKGLKQRRLHKAFLRYHDPENWPMLRAALKRMGRTDLIGRGKHQLVPAYQPATHMDVRVPRKAGRQERPGTGQHPEGGRHGKVFKTQHTRPATGKSGEAHKDAARGARRPGRHLHPGSPTGAGKRRGAR